MSSFRLSTSTPSPSMPPLISIGSPPPLTLTSRTYLLSLPNELLIHIIWLAKAQDSACKKRAERDAERKELDTAGRDPRVVRRLDAFGKVEEGKWYGRSLPALYATCRVLRELTRHEVFECLAVSRSATIDFTYFIAPRHSDAFRHLIIDASCSAETIRHLVHLTLNFPKLEELVISQSCSQFCSAIAAPDEGDDAEENALWDLIVARLARKVVSLKISDESRSISKLLQYFPRLSHLALESDFLTDDTDLGVAIGALDNLQFLKLAFPNSTIPPSWNSSSWQCGGKLKSLDLITERIEGDDWKFVLPLLANLPALSLRCSRLRLDNSLSSLSLPSLTSLRLKSHAHDIVPFLAQIATSPIRHLELNLITSPYHWNNHWDTYFSPIIHQLVHSLRTLSVRTTGAASHDLLTTLGRFCEAHRVAFSPPRLDGDYAFSRIGECVTGGQRLNQARGLKTASNLVRYLSQRVEYSRVSGDETALDDVLEMLGMVAARREIELQ